MNNSNLKPGMILNLKPGDVVEVKTAAEIHSTLDNQGTLEALPFMPEMLAFCGKRFVVFKRADKTCDTIKTYKSLRMNNAVHLDGIRCTGNYHNECEATCLIFWKEAWLKLMNSKEAGPSLLSPPLNLEVKSSTSVLSDNENLLETLLSHTFKKSAETEDIIYTCQATELLRASKPLVWWDFRQYVRDIRSGNVGCGCALRTFLFAALNRGLIRLKKYRGTYHLARFIAAHASPSWVLPAVHSDLKKTPKQILNLQPGEWVEVKALDEIAKTLDFSQKNRGLYFDVPEMGPYCGRKFRVLKRVRKIIDEKTGKTLVMPNDCVILEGAICGGLRSQHRLFCPRSIYPYWREIWLRRIENSE
jgi:hypothetical protein